MSFQLNEKYIHLNSENTFIRYISDISQRDILDLLEDEMFLSFFEKNIKENPIERIKTSYDQTKCHSRIWLKTYKNTLK